MAISATQILLAQIADDFEAVAKQFTAEKIRTAEDALGEDNLSILFLSHQMGTPTRRMNRLHARLITHNREDVWEMLFMESLQIRTTASLYLKNRAVLGVGGYERIAWVMKQRTLATAEFFREVSNAYQEPTPESLYITRLELAGKLNVSERTSQRWEKLGMPVESHSSGHPRYQLGKCLEWRKQH